MGVVKENFDVQVILCPLIYLGIATDYCPLANLWHGHPIKLTKNDNLDVMQILSLDDTNAW